MVDGMSGPYQNSFDGDHFVYLLLISHIVEKGFRDTRLLKRAHRKSSSESSYATNTVKSGLGTFCVVKHARNELMNTYVSAVSLMPPAPPNVAEKEF
jgi:hypothetical protein